MEPAKPWANEKSVSEPGFDLSQNTDSFAHSSAHILSMDMHADGSIFNDVDMTTPACVTADSAYIYTYMVAYLSREVTPDGVG